MKQQLLLIIECLLHFSQWSACNDLTQGSLSYPTFNYEEILIVFFTAFAMHLGILPMETRILSRSPFLFSPT